ncbi:sigma factor-like helix-turn-helix DNA-binding protein, partial [Enterobacter hormaechei]
MHWRRNGRCGTHPAHVREAFLLAHLQGMRYCDIAERLRVSTSSVK